MPSDPLPQSSSPASAHTVVQTLIDRGRVAMDVFENTDQGRIDEAVTALAWSIYKPERAKELAILAVKDTGLGNVSSKILKNTRKTFGTLRDC
jgi:sulfoacetaldehyde dehydrogenase